MYNTSSSSNSNFFLVSMKRNEIFQNLNTRFPIQHFFSISSISVCIFCVVWCELQKINALLNIRSPYRLDCWFKIYYSCSQIHFQFLFNPLKNQFPVVSSCFLRKIKLKKKNESNDTVKYHKQINSWWLYILDSIRWNIYMPFSCFENVATNLNEVN